MRTCKKCKVEHNLSFFNKNSSKKDGISIYCKDCTRARNQLFTDNNPGYRREYYLVNKIACQIAVEKWTERNIDKVRAAHKKYYESNKDAINARRRVVT